MNNKLRNDVLHPCRIAFYTAVLCSFIAFSVSYSWASKSNETSGITLTKKTNTNIATILEGEIDASIFIGALRISNIWSNIQTAKNATIFVPTDRAIKLEGSAFLLEIVLPKSENINRLNLLIAQHLIPNTTVDLMSLNSTVNVTDASGGCTTISPQHFATKVGREAYISGGIKASNGNIYFIDRLLWTPYNENSKCL